MFVDSREKVTARYQVLQAIKDLLKDVVLVLSDSSNFAQLYAGISGFTHSHCLPQLFS